LPTQAQEASSFAVPIARANDLPVAIAQQQVAAASDLQEIGFFSCEPPAWRFSLSPLASTILGIDPAAAPIGIGALRRLNIVGLSRQLRAIRGMMDGGGGQISFDLALRRPDGDFRQIRASLRPLLQAGQVIALTGALVDNTDRNRSEAELRATMSTVPSAMIVIDARGLIRAFSAAAEVMFGRRAAETIGQPIELLMPEPYRSEHAGYLGRYLRTSEARIIGQSRIMNAVRADGTEFPIELWVGDASTEYERLFTGFIRDHSRRFETEAKLQTLQNDLVHVARLSAVGELSMALAHELNQPLGAIVNHLSTAEHLADEFSDRDGGRLAAVIDRAIEQTMRAGAIVKRLRSFIEKGEADKRIEPVATIVHDAISLVSTALRQKGIALSVDIADPDALVLADRIQIQQVLFNLFRNAIEALETGGIARPALSVGVGPPQGGTVEILVEDNGPGIPAGLEQDPFIPFSSAKPDGMGVGLSISRRIMESHGGRLVHQPRPGGGAIFTLVLPAARDGEWTHG
jgi:two-component system sensor kinase FixL